MSTRNKRSAANTKNSKPTKKQRGSDEKQKSSDVKQKSSDVMEKEKVKSVTISHPSHPSYNDVAGFVLTLGEGDVGQLGLGEDILQRSRPTKVVLPEEVLQVYAGGMHTLCLTTTGEVYSFGCNDEGALGRNTSTEGSETTPAKVEGLEGKKIVQVSAGDSHSGALSADGEVFIWGTFRDANGILGILSEKTQMTPISMMTSVMKIASGGDHIACLTTNGQILTCGNGEQGQLGRVAEYFATRGGRKGISKLLNPDIVRFRGKSCCFSDIWAGTYNTFAQVKDSGEIYAWGLNNYYQLGFDDMENRYQPEKLKSIKGKHWKCFCSGQHHTVALESTGKVYCFGRHDYGRLGLGENYGEAKVPTLVSSLNGTGCKSISAGSAVSFCVTNEGVPHAWGMGTNGQLASGSEDDIYEPTKMSGKQLENREVLMISAGGQHTVLLAKEKDAVKT